jgi:hypothetical protein
LPSFVVLYVLTPGIKKNTPIKHNKQKERQRQTNKCQGNVGGQLCLPKSSKCKKRNEESVKP